MTTSAATTISTSRPCKTTARTITAAAKAASRNSGARVLGGSASAGGLCRDERSRHAPILVRQRPARHHGRAAAASAASTSSTVDELGRLVGGEGRPRRPRRSPARRICPARNAATATSLAAFSQAGAAPPARPGFDRQAEAAEGLGVGRREVEAGDVAPVDRAEGRGEPLRVRQGVADREPHVGLGELGDRRPVAELDHRVHDRLRVDDDLDAVVVRPRTARAPR